MAAPRGDGKTTSGDLWKTSVNLKGGRGAVEIWACSRNATGRERKYVWVIGMLRRRQATTRGSEELVWQLEILVRRQGTPRWEDEYVWWLWRGLRNLDGIGGINNNKRHSLGFEQSLTEARKNHLIIWSHCSPPDTR